LRGSERTGSAVAIAWAVAAAIALLGAGCSGRTIVAVDPADCTSGLLDGLVGYWRLDDAVGSPTARDWSGQNNTGTLVGLDPSAAWTAGGPEGGALSPEGQGYVNVPRSASIDGITDQLTVAAWMYLEGTIADYATAISRQIGTGYDQTYHLSVNAQMLAGLFITPPSGQLFIHSSSKKPMPSQTWIHLAGTYDGSQARLYVGGEQVASGAVSGTFAAETNPVVLSGNANRADQTVGEIIPGRLAGVMLYQRALSSDEIARLYTCGSLATSGP
jgi:hypothetical protein